MADAVALFPGGFGTQDEAFEVLTLVQTGKSHLFPIVMLDEPGGDYWVRWQEYIHDVLLKRQLISPADMELFKVTDSVEEAVNEVWLVADQVLEEHERRAENGVDIADGIGGVHGRLLMVDAITIAQANPGRNRNPKRERG